MASRVHNTVEFDSVPTPEWFLSIFRDWHDPHPLGCTGVIEPPPICDWQGPTRIFCNPGYSRKEEAARRCIEWHKAGHQVVMLVPIESSTQFAKTLIQYGCERMFFERRIFPNCRGVELLVLTGR